jgi:hypothetical protein
LGFFGFSKYFEQLRSLPLIAIIAGVKFGMLWRHSLAAA